jgi:L-alanine-DL-glutamate epimerase-like enolase superfamily enzyme
VTRIVHIDVLTAELPFRFAFGHALAERRSSTNVIVRVKLDDGLVGYGEGIPRRYVTGETVEGAVEAIATRLAPPLVGRELASDDDVSSALEELDHASAPTDLAARSAVELAVLDAGGKRCGVSVQRRLGPRRAVVVYDAVIPFSSKRALTGLAMLARALRLRHVKLKVGTDLSTDLAALRLLRRLLGRKAELRVDANCAWKSADEALAAIERMREYGIRAVEQPLPADDLEGLRAVTAETPEAIVVDESLRTVEEALQLARVRACDAFNIRVSKCGGLVNSMRIAEVAAEHGIQTIVGAQVGESGLLSAAGRHLAAAIAPRYVEGSAGRLLLEEDLTEGRVAPGWAGRARPFDGPGLGVRVSADSLRRHATLVRSVNTMTLEVS